MNKIKPFELYAIELGIRKVYKAEGLGLSDESFNEIIDVLSKENFISKKFDGSLFISKKKDYIERAIYLTKLQGETNKHDIYVKELGNLLGYPDCCAEAFVKRFKTDQDYFKIKYTGKLSWLLNVFSPTPLVVHFPCSGKCAKSIELAQKMFNHIKSINPEFAKDIECLSKMKVLIINDSVPPIFFDDNKFISFQEIAENHYNKYESHIFYEKMLFSIQKSKLSKLSLKLANLLNRCSDYKFVKNKLYLKYDNKDKIITFREFEPFILEFE
jgi:hypothetical protein